MSKKNKKGRNKHRVRQQIESETSKSTYSRKNIHSIGTGGLDICPRCGTKLSPDTELSGLTYCASCSLFFWTVPKKKTNLTLSSALSALKRFGGTDILFSDRIPGLVSAIIPETTEGILEILRRLSKPETHTLVEALRSDDVLNEFEISLFINKSGLDRQNVIKVCNALRLAINKKGIYDTETRNPKSQCILTFSTSQTEVFPNEKVKIQWSAIEDSQITYVLISDRGSEKVRPNGSQWITVKSQQKVMLKALYKIHNELESRSLTINLASPPIIHHLLSNLSLPVMETERLKINWNVENADRITLVHRYNDYEKLTVDVTNYKGEFVFTAMRSEILEIIAERRTSRVSKSLMIDVIPLPKFKMFEIPKIIDYSDLQIARIENLTDTSKTEKLFNTLRDLSNLSNLRPYRSFTMSLSEFLNFINRFFN